MNKLDTYCPGAYCGRLLLNGTFGECGGCPRGFRSNSLHICTECSEELTLYDWLYLCFMIIIFSVIQCYFIDKSIKSNKFNYLSFTLYLSTICESIIASLLSILSFNNEWNLNLKSCGVKSFSDWYTLFYNPSINDNFYCTHEAVYPLYSIVFVFYIISLGLVLTRHFYLRIIGFIFYLISSSNYIKKLYSKNHITTNIYYILYSIPALMFIHSIFAGIIYYIYPYLVIIGSVISIAVHHSHHIDQSSRYLLHSIFEFRNFLIVFIHWSLHAFGIVSLTELKHTGDYLLLALVPLPTLFYIFTSKFTDPSKL